LRRACAAPAPRLCCARTATAATAVSGDLPALSVSLQRATPSRRGHCKQSAMGKRDRPHRDAASHGPANESRSEDGPGGGPCTVRQWQRRDWNHGAARRNSPWSIQPRYAEGGKRVRAGRPPGWGGSRLVGESIRRSKPNE
jgi:hypothetical protein